MRILLAACLVTFAVVAAGAAEPVTAGDGEMKVFHYRDASGNDAARCEIEVHFPKGHDASKPVPAVILFHGGAWRRGDREDMRPICEYLAGRGIVAASANYQFQRDKKDVKQKRNCITSAKSAIRWYKQHAAELGVDPSRIVTGGSSAGGHICLLATLNPGLNHPDDPADIDTSVAAYLLFCPAVKTKIHEGDPEVHFEKHLGNGMAPALVFLGENDSWNGHWSRSHEVAKQAGIKAAEQWVGPGQPHGFTKEEPWRTLAFIKIDEFLVSQGLLTGACTLEAPATGEQLVKKE